MINGNLAYKYEAIENAVLGTTKAKNRKRHSKKIKNNEMSYGSKIAMVFCVAICAVFMIIQYVTVNDTETDLASAISQYKFEESVTAQKAFELEQKIDLSKIEAEATSRLGMRRPERYQVVYLDVKKSDVTLKTANEVEGFGNRFSDFMGSIKNNIIEFFSI